MPRRATVPRPGQKKREGAKMKSAAGFQPASDVAPAAFPMGQLREDHGGEVIVCTQRSRCHTIGNFSAAFDSSIVFSSESICTKTVGKGFIPTQNNGEIHSKYCII